MVFFIFNYRLKNIHNLPLELLYGPRGTNKNNGNEICRLLWPLQFLFPRRSTVNMSSWLFSKTSFRNSSGTQINLITFLFHLILFIVFIIIQRITADIHSASRGSIASLGKLRHGKISYLSKTSAKRYVSLISIPNWSFLSETHCFFNDLCRNAFTVFCYTLPSNFFFLFLYTQNYRNNSWIIMKAIFTVLEMKVIYGSTLIQKLFYCRNNYCQ